MNVGLSDEVTEAVLTVVIGWLAERDREVAVRAWDEGFNSGYNSVLVDRSMKIPTVDYRENPYREPNA